MIRALRWWLMMSSLAAPVINANPLQSLPSQGWSSWEVADVVDVAYRCCFTLTGKDVKAQVCDLDRQHGGFAASDAFPSISTSLRIYVETLAGEIRSIQSYSSNCPVRSTTPVVALAPVSVERSVAWLGAQLAGPRRLAAPALAALALHPGGAAQLKLETTARSDPKKENRKDALFWLGQNRGEAGALAIIRQLALEADASVREHAVFALSQSDWPEKSHQLTALAKSDRAPDIRAKAWFWLANIAAPNVERDIFLTLPIEPNREVQEEAIFALAQLPPKRSVPALIGLVEQKSLRRELRKKALFWLGQNESEQAQRYLAAMLK